MSSIDCSPMARASTLSARRPKADCTAWAEPPDRIGAPSVFGVRSPSRKSDVPASSLGHAEGCGSRGKRGAGRAIGRSARTGARGGSGSVTAALRRGAGGAGGGDCTCKTGSMSRQARRGVLLRRASARLAARWVGSRGAAAAPVRDRVIFSRSCSISLDVAAGWPVMACPTGGAAVSGPMSSLMALRIEARRSSMRGSAVTSSTLSGASRPVE